MQNIIKHLLKGYVKSNFAYSKCRNASKVVSPVNVFDRNTKRLQKDVASGSSDAHLYDYLKDEVAYRVADRVFDIKRRFNVCVDLGCSRGHLGPYLTQDVIDVLLYCDMSSSCLKNSKTSDELKPIRLLVDEEKLPFRENSIDLVLSNLSLHWVNDLPATFTQILECLKSDGVLIGSMFGGDTLFELRCSLQLAEVEREGGFGPHISPFVTPQDIAALLSRAGFTMLTIDSDTIKVNFPTMFELMQDLKGMAENNALWNRKAHLHRDTLIAAASIYKTLYGNKDGSIPASFQIFYFIGWKPHSSQQQPAERGSGNFSLKDIANLEEILKKQ